MATVYVRTGQEGAQPGFLGISQQGVNYDFRLQTFHLAQQNTPPASSRSEHLHSVFHLVLYHEGESSMLLNGVPHAVGPGSLVFISPGDAHTFSPDTESVVYDEITFSYEDGEKVYEGDLPQLLGYYSGQNLGFAGSCVLDLGKHEYTVFSSCFRRIGQALTSAPIDWLGGYRSVLDLLCLGLGALEQESSTIHAVRDEFDEIRESLAANLSEDISISQLAAACHISPEHFCRKFSKRFGISPIAYRQKLRIAAAENLLSNSELLCKEIAGRLGFCDVYAFSKAFKKEKGISPMQYRDRASPNSSGLY